MSGMTTPDCTDPPAGDDLDRSVSGMLRLRGVVIGVLVTVFLALPAVALFRQQGLSGDAAFLVPGTVVFVVLVDRWVLVSRPQLSHHPVRDVAVMWVIVVLGAALFAVGQMNWLTALAVAAAAAGRFAAAWPRAAIGVAGCAAVGLAVSVWHNFDYGALLAAFAVPLLGGLFAYSAERRNVLIYALKETRAELARMAVAEERLRISRDLHDLLGHSLSLIALKGELAGRMIESDPQRAAREIGELEAVARRSLAEVRQTVTGYRRPNLAAELAAARRMRAPPVLAGRSARFLAASRAQRCRRPRSPPPPGRRRRGPGSRSAARGCGGSRSSSPLAQPRRARHPRRPGAPCPSRPPRNRCRRP